MITSRRHAIGERYRFCDNTSAADQGVDGNLGHPRETLGVGLQRLYRMIDTGKIPAYKIGRVIRLRRVD